MNKNGGSRSRSSTGTPNERMRRRATLPHPLECSTIAVPGLSFRVRKGTGRLTWAMTTAKPIQDGQPPTGIGRQRNQPRFRSWRSGNRTTDANDKRLTNHHCDHKKQRSLPSNEKTTTGRDPTHQRGSERVCRVRPLVPVGSIPRGTSTSGLSNTCSTCGLQTPKCQGILILEQASRLDAFSGYPSRT